MGFKNWLKNKMSQIDVTRGDNNFNINEKPNSTGNTYDFLQQYNASLSKAFTNPKEFMEKLSVDYDTDDIDSYIEKRSLNEWWMLQLQANYFVNTINFRCSNFKIELAIRKVIKAAFLYGKAGLYFDKLSESWIPVMIAQEKVTTNNNIYYAKLYYIYNFDNEYKFINHDIEIKTYEDARNLIVFRWGVDAQSAIIYHYPFIRLQTQILKQLTLTSLVLAKKVEYHVMGSNPNKKEISNWLNPFKFIVTVFNGGSKNGRFQLVKRENNDNGLAEIEYYNHLIRVYYSLYGRRVNEDVKKERNVSAEIDASQENFDVLQRNWKSMFILFIKELKANVDGANQIGEIEVYE